MNRLHRHIHPILNIILLLLTIIVTSCSSTKHVPENKYLLDKVKIVTDNKDVNPQQLRTYVQQHPNYRTLGFIPLKLGVYNLSSNKSSNSFNKWLRNIGDAPVIYSQERMEESCMQLNKALSNMGYMHAQVTSDTISRNRRMEVTYNIKTNEPFFIDTIFYDIPHHEIDSIVHSQPSIIEEGMLLDRSLLSQERDRLTALIRQNGYYAFGKEMITFNADTISTSRATELTIKVLPVSSTHGNEPLSYDNHIIYRIHEVYFITDPALTNIDLTRVDISNAERYKNINIVYGKNRYLSAAAMAENCFVEPGDLYNTSMVERTYTSFGRLSYLRNINIRFLPRDREGNEMQLDCFIFLSPGKSQSISAEIEGTNSEGDLGAAVQLTYQHRNIFKGSELFTAEVRGAYESISGTLQGIINDHYTELGARMGWKFPKLLFPFFSYDLRRKIPATTEFDLSLNFQQRPEYTRIIAGAGWRYNWSRAQHRHRLDLLDINYVYLPQYMEGFLEQIAPSNPLLRYSYEDHFIMSIGYNFYTSNIPSNSPLQRTTLSNAYTLRTSIETAGNLLYGISNAIGSTYDNGYKIFGIRYSQYVKGNIDYSFLHNFNHRHSLAFHCGLGVGIPYGNSSMMPFEKRFYSGGANSVRGWSVRTLGPGSYNGQNNMNSFIYQCGDIRLDLSIEYRAKLFWKIESALFIDAGNIWTIADYETQPGGVFRFDTFYKEIALAYGLGIRLNFDFVVIRADFGMKAYNPAKDAVKWAIAHPNFSRDFAWHLTIGYPF